MQVLQSWEIFWSWFQTFTSTLAYLVQDVLNLIKQYAW
jgi:hypothetical protein